MSTFRAIDCGSLYPATSIEEFDRCINGYTKTELKAFLNSIYGKGVETMRNDFMVLHVDETPLLIRKDAIVGIKKSADGTAGIMTMPLSYFIYVDETYEEVVRKLFK